MRCFWDSDHTKSGRFTSTSAVSSQVLSTSASASSCSSPVLPALPPSSSPLRCCTAEGAAAPSSISLVVAGTSTSVELVIPLFAFINGQGHDEDSGSRDEEVWPSSASSPLFMSFITAGPSSFFATRSTSVSSTDTDGRLSCSRDADVVCGPEVASLDAILSGPPFILSSLFAACFVTSTKASSVAALAASSSLRFVMVSVFAASHTRNKLP
mmetsp:Transcript_8533/g.20652  ORF Transcript_8533/g.20652 Transcript_8533/m.20652 type:complete len:212 (-) Transcript_8533:106-741(-)